MLGTVFFQRHDDAGHNDVVIEDLNEDDGNKGVPIFVVVRFVSRDLLSYGTEARTKKTNENFPTMIIDHGSRSRNPLDGGVRWHQNE